MKKKNQAPKSVQEFRRIVRQDCRFYRGTDPTADRIVDNLIAWVVHDIFTGEIETPERAAEVVGKWMAASFGRKGQKSA